MAGITGPQIGEILDARGLKQKPFAESIGVKVSTLYGLVRGVTDVDKVEVQNFIRIARGLGMTADELYHYDEVGTGDRLSEDEHRLVDLYREANQQGKVSIMAIAEVQRGIEGESQARLSVSA